VRDAGVDAAGEVVGEARGEAPPCGERHGGWWRRSVEGGPGLALTPAAREHQGRRRVGSIMGCVVVLMFGLDKD
jgi:hypothetical protein